MDLHILHYLKKNTQALYLFLLLTFLFLAWSWSILNELKVVDTLQLWNLY